MDVALAARLLKVDTAALDDAAIRRAYRVEAAKVHPDRLVNPSAVDLERANKAFSLLTTALNVMLDHAARDPEPVEAEDSTAFTEAMRILTFEEFVAELDAAMWRGEI